MQNSFVRVPPDGAGKRIQTTQHIISGNTVEIQHFHLADLDKPQNTWEINDAGAGIIAFPEGVPTLDTFNNVKVAQEKILGVYEFSNDSNNDLYYDDIQDTGTITYENTKSLMLLDTGSSNSGAQARRTTNRNIFYQPGVFQKVVLVVSCGDVGKPNNVRKWGAHNDENGMFFALSGTTMCVGWRSNISGTVIDYLTPQSEWNVDKLDGTGLSGVVLNPIYSYQYWFGYSWPNGMVKYGIQHPISGRIVCHIISGSGVSPYPIMRTASLPIRFSNRNVGITSGNSQLNMISATVQTNSNSNETFWRFADMNCVNKTVSPNTAVPLVSVRAKMTLDNGNENHINSYPENLSVFSSGASLKVTLVWATSNDLTSGTWLLNSVGGPLEGDNAATLIDTGSTDYWASTVFYIKKDEPMNIDLTPYFELNDEGVLLDGNHSNISILSFVGTTLGSGTASVSLDLSYRSLY